mmetsp:Transcript_10382/g.25637  ORF Transcript_10382/g.25637 Transcript_10382/m.25637 type:complete len:102 (-) Transcript_10382:93-398(-)
MGAVAGCVTYVCTAGACAVMAATWGAHGVAQGPTAQHPPPVVVVVVVLSAGRCVEIVGFALCPAVHTVARPKPIVDRIRLELPIVLGLIRCCPVPQTRIHD